MERDRASLWCLFRALILLGVTSLVAQTVKRLPAMRETRVRFLGREDALEKEMAIHSSILAWRMPWTEEPDRLLTPVFLGFPGGSAGVKNLPAMWETWVRSLGWADLLEKEMATLSSTRAWKIPWMEEPGRHSPWGPKESDRTERLHFHLRSD